MHSARARRRRLKKKTYIGGVLGAGKYGHRKQVENLDYPVCCLVGERQRPELPIYLDHAYVFICGHET